MKKSYLLILLLLNFLSCKKKDELVQFKALSSKRTHIDFTNNLKNTPELNILTYLYYYNGAGVAVADFNNDGLKDLYFTSNQSSDELYLNKGDFNFLKATEKSQIKNDFGWTTGVTHVDINNDGLLDIYICKVAGYKNLKGKNLLYVNQGIDKNGIPKFKEQAQEYGIAFSGLSTQAAFFDYDLDGDLDMYLMNHSVYPNRTYGKGNQRTKKDSLAGDILYENKNGFYTDVSNKAGIFQGKSGYGLGLSINDINNDNYPDIYIGNDFFENDYLYINQKDGTFKELISNNSNKIGHTTHFSMGNSIEDINNDGLSDILSLDMLPENIETYKTSGLEYGFPIYQQYLKNGYAPQYMSNTLHLNLGNENFSEIANLSGIAASEWSWGALIADFDNDGLQDVYISNGIKGATNDMDYMNFIANEDIQRRIDAGMKETDLPLINEIPEKKIINYFFQNKGKLQFENQTKAWSNAKPTFSNGCIYADLDNDGDLDIVVNNVNEKATILENKNPTGSYLQIKLTGLDENKNAIGAKITAYTKTQKITRQHFNTKSYLSSLSNTIHLGFGKDSILDSLKIVWPNGKVSIQQNVNANQVLTFNIKDSNTELNPDIKYKYDYTTIDSLLNFKHKESQILDFNREPLIPFALSNKGPHINITDFNKDGLDDVFITGGKKQASELFIQSTTGEFKSINADAFKDLNIDENTASIFFDANGDAKLDLIIVSGGNEFKTGAPIQPKLLLNKNDSLSYKKDALPLIELNASKIDTVDFNKDGLIDLCITSDAIASAFGKTPKQYILQNNGNGNFTDVTEKLSPSLSSIGNVTDFIWKDIDNNSYPDLIIVGHWMPITIFLNDGKQLRLQKDNQLKNTNGLWNTLKVEDFDNDGDLDFVAGNWGLNTKLRASEDKPIRLYIKDFDANGTVDPILTYYHKNTETPFASKDEIVKQIPSINKQFLSYNSFAKASIKELFGEKEIKSSEKKEIYELRSCYFENDGNGNFIKHPLPIIAQKSVIFDFALDDINKDGFKDLLIVGNNYDISTQLGRLDAFHGLLLRNSKKNSFIWEPNIKLDISGAARVIKPIKIKGDAYFIVGINNEAPLFIRKN